MSDAPVVFDSAFEALKKAMGSKLNRVGLEQFRAIGVDYEKKLAPAYPLPIALEAVRIAGKIYAPSDPEPVAMEKLGRRISQTFAETMVGKALFATLRVLGVKSGLSGLQRSLRMNNNYVKTKLTELGPNEVELWVGPITFPTYYSGIFAEGLSAVGARDVKVELVRSDA